MFAPSARSHQGCPFTIFIKTKASFVEEIFILTFLCLENNEILLIVYTGFFCSALKA